MSFIGKKRSKNSNTEWWGEIPKHWEIKRLKFVAANKKFSIVDGPFGTQLKADEYCESGVPLVRISNLSYSGRFQSSDLVFLNNDKAKELERSSICRGDIVVGKTGATIGKTALIKDFSFGIIASSCLKISPNKEILMPEFLLYTMISEGFQKILINSAGGSTRDTINIEPFGNLSILLPPFQDQKAIVAFLDGETAKIDKLISEQQNLINLLKEKRQAIISNAVTNGLNPDAPLKDSGVEWLGSVPMHWEIKPFKRIVSVPITDGPHETPCFYDTGVPFVSAEAVSTGRIDFSKIRGYISSDDNRKYSLKYSPQLHDIYIVKSGATTGITAIVEERTDFNIWSPLAVIRCGRGANPYFVLNFMRSKNFIEAIELNWSFGTQQNIGMGVIENLPCVIPPVNEQVAIVEYLKNKINNLDKLTSEAQKAIEFLQERRKAIIYATVTGKIDVRKLSKKEVE